MPLLTQRAYNWWLATWRGDPYASDLPMQGEHRAARTRVIAVGVLTLVNVLVLLLDPDNIDFSGSLPVNLVALALSFAILRVTRRGTRPRALSVATVIGDVTAVSLLHVHDLMRDLPSVALNGRLTYSAYFLAMVGSCLRFNPWLAGLSGLVAAAEYGVIAAWGIAIWPSAVTADIVQHGVYDWGVQIERMAALLVFGWMCASISSWAVALRSTATHDPLTGLLNRRTFEEQLHGEILRSQRTGEPIGVAMIDVDHFKRVNDTYGHHAGDLALGQIAALLRDTVRRTDLAGRWGGEEFALVFPSERPEATVVHLERLRQAVESSVIQLPHGDRITLTISAGAAFGPEDGSDGAALIRMADARLLDAKRSGRNRIVRHGVPMLRPQQPAGDVSRVVLSDS